MDNSQTTLWEVVKALHLYTTLSPYSNQTSMKQSCLLTYLFNPLEQVCALFRNSCQLFLPARNRRPSWFSPLNQILRGVRRGGGTPKTSLVLRFPLCGQKDGVILTKPSVISGTRGFPCRLHASFTLPAPS